MSSTDAPRVHRPGTETTSLAALQPGHGQVPPDLLTELGEAYTAYRETLTRPWDPVTTLHRTGDVLASVRRILTATQQIHHETPATSDNWPDQGKAGQ